ncbi:MULTISPECIES: hypothetical protein [Halomonas]|uniref:hypothetical protein n=1 Tax=Halomonas TaxID=2745 RepID=UPI001C976A08|nr:MULTISPECIES: hypothetical protein [Halomonas]MED5296089.1 hypothetical protein [Pseudomonadota bacterium]MBY5931082.1 hypothetical protein [Halomonas sp. DP8Y7-3]MBY6209233.1 hypothetical protein [Halomonas sp. DP3Y7-2]MBY6229388.1 hypothetical protein [Halomonas sp. DP3Y7-1]MCA0917549.1 hypothetical protein [Halomonas denitrificans]
MHTSSAANTPPLPPLRHRLAALLLLTGLAMQVASMLAPWLPSVSVSLPFWLASALLWPDIPRRNQWQAGVLALLGVLFLAVAMTLFDARPALMTLLDGNAFVVAMLTGVSFIALIGRPPTREPTSQPVTGRRGLIGTWLGVHLLGGILNLSTVFMVGDRLERRGPLSEPQLLGLNRGLSSAALWSPFFAAMGVVLSLAPSLQYTTLLSVGLPLAFAGGLYSVIELSRRFDVSTVPGFSLSPASLLMPAVIAALVMLFHFVVTPSLTIVSIITFLMPLLAIVTNLARGLSVARERMVRHFHYRLPGMRGEITLFLCAGLLTKGLSVLVDAATAGNWTLFPEFGALAAASSYLAIVISAIAGLHPIIGVSVLASMLELDGPHQTLFGFVALASWAVGTSVGPLSGINLSLQGRYGVSGYRMMRHNLRYALVMSLLVLAAIAWLGHAVAA